MSERERERDKNDKQRLLDSFLDLDQYYQKNTIKDISYNPSYFIGTYDLYFAYESGGEWLTTFTELPTNIQPTLTSYFVDNHNSSLSRQQLGTMINRLQSELKNEEKKPTNYTPYILGGVGATVVIGVLVVVYLLGQNSERKRRNYA